INFSRTQHWRRERRLIGRVGEMFRFQAKAIPGAVRLCTFSWCPFGEEISAVELNARFRGIHRHDASTLRFIYSRAQAEFARVTGNHPTVIVALPVDDLRVVIIDALTHFSRLTEVEWCTCDIFYGAGRN